jgi:hypothetical protein
MDMKNFLCPLRRLSPTAPANSAAKTAASDTLTRSGQTQQPRRKFSNDPLFGVIFSFVLFTLRRHYMPRVHIWDY